MSPRDCKQVPVIQDDTQHVCPQCGQRHAPIEVAAIAVTPAQLTALLGSLVNNETRAELLTWLQRTFPYGVPPPLQPLVEIATRR